MIACHRHFSSRGPGIFGLLTSDFPMYGYVFPIGKPGTSSTTYIVNKAIRAVLEIVPNELSDTRLGLIFFAYVFPRGCPYPPPANVTWPGKKVSENFVGKLGISAFRFFLVEIRTSIKNRFSGANKMKSLGILKSIENDLFSVFFGFSVW